MSAPFRRIEVPPITQPDMRPVGRRLYELWARWDYTWQAPTGKVLRIEIEKCTVTDGASVPSLLWTLTGILPDGLHRPAALVHDVMYRDQGHVVLYTLSPNGRALQHWSQWLPSDWEPLETQWSRRDADRLFARILRELNVSRWDRRLMYRGVRLGGWWGWYVSPVLRRWRRKA